MTTYIDSVIIIDLMDHVGPFQVRAADWIAAASMASDRLSVSDLTRFEFRMMPMRLRDRRRLDDFDGFFRQGDVRLVPPSGAVFDLATAIRAEYGYKIADSIHLAAAIESGSDRFLTNDLRLAGFTGLPVEILP